MSDKIYTQLSVNINKIALIRNSREGNYPDLLEHAQACIQAGAHSITIHPRPDQRHVRAADALQLKETLTHELNIEGNPFAEAMRSTRHDVADYPGFIHLVEQCLPAQCTLVPDTQMQLTSDHGFDLKRDGSKLETLIKRLKKNNIRVSIFLDPQINQINLAKEIGADRIELYTGPYANLYAQLSNNYTVDLPNLSKPLFEQYTTAAEHALDIGLELNAGHDLNLFNLQPFKQLVPKLHEVSIGHALTVEAIKYGLQPTIKKYLKLLSS